MAQFNKFEGRFQGNVEGDKLRNIKSNTLNLRKIKRNNVQIAFIKFTIKQTDDKEVTFYSSTHTVRGDSGKSRPDYILSLKNQRYAEKANVGTVEIVYVPQGTQNPNMVEEAMAKSDNGHCEIQYGNEGYTSRVYRGMITDYRTTLDNGYLRYSIDFVSESAFSTLLTIKDELCNVPEEKEESLKEYYVKLVQSSDLASINGGGYYERIFKDIPYTDKRGGTKTYRVNNVDEDSMQRISEEVNSEQRYFEEYFKKNYVLVAMWHIVNKYLKDSYEFDIEHSDKGFENPRKGVHVIGENPLKALKHIASSLVDASDSSVYSYTIVVSDSVTESKKGTITLKRYGVSSQDNPSLMYEFDWNSRDSDVISFSPNYNGTYITFGYTNIPSEENYSAIKLEYDETKQGYYLDNTNLSNLKSLSKVIQSGLDTPLGAISLDEAYRNAVTNALSFLKHANYPYEASLTVFGLPDTDVELIDTKVAVVPLINGLRHHSAGVYQVIGITDNVSTNGFQTTLNLIRCIDESRLFRSENHIFYYSGDGTKTPLFDADIDTK